jgi:hypothetical protein
MCEKHNKKDKRSEDEGLEEYRRDIWGDDPTDYYLEEEWDDEQSFQDEF